MTDRHVYIFMPTFSGKPRIETFHAMLDVERRMHDRGWKVTWKFTVRDSMIFRSRNMALADFYVRKEHTDLVMLDDDLEWESGALIRLLSHPVDFVAGAYPKRQEKLEFTVKSMGLPADPATGLMEVRRVAAGFLRVTRNCVERMVAAHPELAYRETLVRGGKAWALFFNHLWDDEEEPDADGLKQLWGEDFSFCKRWRDMGGAVWCDTLLRFKHFGEKAYEGCYAEHIPGFLEQIQQTRSAA